MSNQENNSQQVYSLKQDIFEWMKAILIALVIVVLVRWLLFTPTLVSGQSMEPNFHNHERVIVNKIIYDIREPKRGEVIVFHAPEEKDYIKRVIGLPGDIVKVEGDQIFINDRLIEESYIQAEMDEAASKGITYNRTANFKMVGGELVGEEVPVGNVFVLGDNRSNSKDSRSSEVGYVPYEKIVGRADITFWPISEFKIIKHPDGVIE